MTNEEVLQRTLSTTLERIAKQTMSYETEIANLNAQLILMASQKEEGPPVSKTSNRKQEKDPQTP